MSRRANTNGVGKSLGSGLDDLGDGNRLGRDTRGGLTALSGADGGANGDNAGDERSGLARAVSDCRSASRNSEDLGAVDGAGDHVADGGRRTGVGASSGGHRRVASAGVAGGSGVRSNGHVGGTGRSTAVSTTWSGGSGSLGDRGSRRGTDRAGGAAVAATTVSTTWGAAGSGLRN